MNFFKKNNFIILFLIIVSILLILFLFSKETKKYDLNKNNLEKIIEIFSKEKKIKHLEIIKSYTKEKNSFTQGLISLGNMIIESDGLYNRSSLKEYAFFSKDKFTLLKDKKLPKNIFAEGITILRDNKIALLTWKSGIGYIYKKSPETYQWEKIDEFKYKNSKEGWGLTSFIDLENHPGKDKIYKSDGTSRIWFLNPETFKEESFIEVNYDGIKIDKINELEYINGNILANIWLTDYILEINPKNGNIENIIDASILKKEILKSQKINQENDVLNGIAYDNTNNILYMTGKNWNKLFEVKIVD